MQGKEPFWACLAEPLAYCLCSHHTPHFTRLFLCKKKKNKFKDPPQNPENQQQKIKNLWRPNHINTLEILGGKKKKKKSTAQRESHERRV